MEDVCGCDFCSGYHTGPNPRRFLSSFALLVDTLPFVMAHSREFVPFVALFIFSCSNDRGSALDAGVV